MNAIAKAISVKIVFVLAAAMFAVNGFGAEAPLPFSGLMVGGWGFGHIALVTPDGKETWSLTGTGNVCDVWPLDAQTVLHVTGRSVREVQVPAAGKGPGKVLWEWKAAEKSELHGCQPLASNRVLVAECQATCLRLVELERGTTNEVFSLKIEDRSLICGGHGSARSVRKTARGTYLFGCMAGFKGGGAEVDASGKILHRFPSARYGVFERPKGGFLAGGGDERCVTAFDADGKEEWRIKAEDIPGFTLMFVAQVHEFEDGRLLIANWGGHHGNLKINSPCLGLISADRKQLLWSAQLTPRNAVASFQVIQQTERTGL
jgi:hypothetical protein